MPRYTLRIDTAAVQRELRPAAAQGLLLAAEYVLGESNAIVPIDEDALARSGTATVDEGSLTAAVAYDTPYAVIQHERMDFRHAPGRRAKFLESSLNSSADEVRDIIAAQLRRALR